MKKMITVFLFITIAFAAGCSSPNDNSLNTGRNDKIPGEIILEINYEMGSITPCCKNIYAVWIENEASGFLQNISICKRLVKGGLTGTALPFWSMFRYPKSDMREVDVVTGATKGNVNFTVSAKLKDVKIKKFKVYIELDRSFDPNDWFNNQPAILYSAAVDLDKPVNEYELKFCGWTPNEITENIIPGTPKGMLQKEMKYITHHKSGKGFGTVDPDHPANNMVKRITLNVIR